jgi:hypothetical protein
MFNTLRACVQYSPTGTTVHSGVRHHYTPIQEYCTLLLPGTSANAKQQLLNMIMVAQSAMTPSARCRAARAGAHALKHVLAGCQMW